MRPSARQLLWAVVGLAALTGSSAKAAGPSPVAIFHAGATLVEWTPVVDSAGIVLTVADPQGLVRTFQFLPGEAPALSLFDAQGAPLPDGTFTWELRAAPRSGDDPRRETAPLVQFGHFTLAGGKPVPPDLPERKEPNVLTAADQMVPDDLIVEASRSGLDSTDTRALHCPNPRRFDS